MKHRMLTNKTTRKVKAAALGAPTGVISSYAGMKLAMPDFPDEVTGAIVALVSALLAWLFGRQAHPAEIDKITTD